MNSPTQAYRIVEIKNGLPHTLFHGLPSPDGRRSRRIQTDVWLDAEVKPVSYGRTSPFMESGFNVLLDRAECEAYLARFTAARELKVVRCLVQGIVPKPRAQSNVLLARRMYLPASEASV
jgi:hypothetical protein